jgi:predicted NBD/HSP70 family sugar kinase
VTPLIGAGFIVESDENRPSPSIGRPISPLAVAHDRAHIIGVKITADRTYGVLTDLGANTLARTEELNATPTVPDVITAVTRVVDTLRAASDTPIDGLGVAVSGDVDRDGGVVRDSPLLGWRQVPLAKALEEATGIPTVLENDVRALAVTELFFGSGRDAESFAIVTIGTGIGCGIYLHGRVVQGAHGVAGEIGHLPLAPDDAVCACGRRGCVEAVASTAAILDLIRRGHDDDSLTIDDAFALAHQDDPIARNAFEQAGAVIGSALAALVNLIGPELVVIAGENVTEYELYEAHLRSTFAEHAFGAASDCEIVLRPHVFDDWARGAAACVVEVIASGVSAGS